MKKALYTINFGEYDSLKEPYITEGWDYICFTNNDIKSDTWDVRKVKSHLPNNLAARYYYTQSNSVLPQYDLTIMIGGQISCDCDLNKFLEDYIDLSYDYNLMNHCRNCTYDEANENKKFFKAKGNAMIDYQMDNYQKQGFPKDYGLYAHGIIVTKKSETIKSFQQFWWDEISNQSYVTRDQLSFMYSIWKKNNIRHRSFAEYWDFLHSGLFSIYSHGFENKKL